MSLAREPESTPTAKTRGAGRGRLDPDIDPASTPVPGRTHPAPPGVVRSFALALQRTAGNGAATALVKAAGPTVQRTVNIVEEPCYDQSGVLHSERTGGLKNAEFDFGAKFDRVPEDGPPHPLEVRQHIRWDKKYEDTAGGPPPHFGNAAAGEWHEDRFPDTLATGTSPAVPGTRYGHRQGEYANLLQERDCLDKYLEHGQTYASDRLIGEEYVGSDSPKVLLTSQGQFDFQLTVVDMSKGGQVVTTSEVLTVDWNDAPGADAPGNDAPGNDAPGNDVTGSESEGDRAGR